MSEDKNNDAQTDDEPKAEEQKPAEEPRPKKAAPKPKPDVVDEEELDIEIERVAPKPSSSCGPVAWILFILVIAVIAIFGGMKINQVRIEAEKKARAQREVTYQTQEQTIRENIEKASDYASKGDVENSYKQLNAARDKWSQMASMANSARDTDKAQYALGRESDLKKVIDELDSYKAKAADLQRQADVLKAQRDDFNDKANARILELAGAGGAGGAEAEATGAKPEEPAEKKAKADADAAKSEPAEVEKKSDKKDADKPADETKKAEKPKKRAAKKTEKIEADKPEAPRAEAMMAPQSAPSPASGR